MKTPFWWKKKGIIAFILLPLSLLFASLASARRKAYQIGLFKSYQAPVPVIIIGNISVGGTGKTPLLIAIIEYLKSQNISVGVVSRGYGGTYTDSTLSVTTQTKIQLCGDEPYLIAKRTQVPVVVGKKRDKAVQALLKAHPVACILTDDGLQHYALKRDFEVVVIDAQTRFGNQFLLPSGALREPISRLKTVDACISQAPQLPHEFKMTLQVQALVNLKTAELKPIDAFINQSVIALAGIGNPEKFYQTLQDHQINLNQTFDFPDHYAFKAEDIQFDSDLPIIMTEKDALKCLDFATQQHWYLAIEIQPEPAFLALIKKTIESKYTLNMN